MRVILFEAPMNHNNGQSDCPLDLSYCGTAADIGTPMLSPSGRRDLESKLAVVQWVSGPKNRINLLTARRMYRAALRRHLKAST